MSSSITVKSYGTWHSPITTDLIVSKSITLERSALDKQTAYWVERRPSENGRSALVCRTPDGTTTTLTPEGYSVRSRVHEYGGGEYIVQDGTIYFANFYDNHLYHQIGNSQPVPLTTNSDLRYADMSLDQSQNRLICVREDHRKAGEPISTIVSVSLDAPNDGHILLSGNDFYAAPRVSPDGRQLAWLTWQHPNMPWDGCQLWLADIEANGLLSNHTHIAGSQTDSIFQPTWSPDGTLYFVAEPDGWWNLYRWHNEQIEAIHPLPAEFGRPLWGLNMTTYAFATANTMVASYTQKGRWYLAKIELDSNQFIPIELPYTDFSKYSNVCAYQESALITAGSATEPHTLLQIDLIEHTFAPVRKENNLNIDSGYISQPQAIAYPTSENQTAHAFYYPPYNQDYRAPEDEKPPLIVLGHGGPTAATQTALNWNIQYWTSRGFAIVDVNYRGSSGYGRSYRRALNKQWGIIDVEDCLNAARYLVDQGLADPNRLAVKGGSAGGYLVFCALAYHDLFNAGASYFGVSDVIALAQETHKFESRYVETLIEPAQFKARSPIHAAHHIRCPLILFQGLEDRVVPPNQSEMMYTAVRDQGVPVAYIAYEGEGHGFRQDKNIKHSLEAELYFYSRIFNFTPATQLPEIPIENLNGYHT